MPDSHTRAEAEADKEMADLGTPPEDSTLTYLGVSPLSEGFAVAHKSTGEAVMLDDRGHELSTGPHRFRWILPLCDGRARACTTDGAVGWLGPDGVFKEESADPEWVARTELVRVGKLIYRRDYNAASNGNLSYRLSDDEILVTPAGAHKGFLDAADLVVVDHQGRKVSGMGTPTSEHLVHARIYELRDDIRCIIHVHTPYALAASLAGVDLRQTYVMAPPVPTTEYAPPSSAQCPEVLEPYIRDYNGAILPRHGLVVWADSIWKAFVRIEDIEHLAKAVLTAAATGPIAPVSAEQGKELLRLWNRHGQDRGESKESASG